MREPGRLPGVPRCRAMPAACFIASLLTPLLESDGRLKLSLDELLSTFLAKSWLEPKSLGLPGPGRIFLFLLLCLFLISVVSSLIFMNSGRESFSLYVLFSSSTSCVIENDPRRLSPNLDFLFTGIFEPLLVYRSSHVS